MWPERRATGTVQQQVLNAELRAVLAEHGVLAAFVEIEFETFRGRRRRANYQSLGTRNGRGLLRKPSVGQQTVP